MFWLVVCVVIVWVFVIPVAFFRGVVTEENIRGDRIEDE